MRKNFRGDLPELTKEEFISNYDLNQDYLYKFFWKGREYEHRAELLLLKRLFKRFVYSKRNKNQVILDLGGSFGRLAELYLNHFKYSIIGDYSLQELFEAKKRLFKQDPNLYLVGLNAYKMPFRNNSMDYVLSVRLAHHIRYLDIFAKEIYRVLRPGGILVLEVAHKNHIKALLRAIFKLDYTFFKKELIEVKHNPNEAQGIKDAEGQIPIMYNFATSYVLKVFTNNTGFRLKGIFPCSFFRIPFLKKAVPTTILLNFEKVMQFLSFLRLTPSLFYVFQKPALHEIHVRGEARSFVDLLQCPDKTHLIFEQNKILCDNKITDMKKLSRRMFDLRDPRPDKIKF